MVEGLPGQVHVGALSWSPRDDTILAAVPGYMPWMYQPLGIYESLKAYGGRRTGAGSQTAPVFCYWGLHHRSACRFPARCCQGNVLVVTFIVTLMLFASKRQAVTGLAVQTRMQAQANAIVSSRGNVDTLLE